MAEAIGSLQRPPEGGPSQGAYGAVAYTDIEDSTRLWERHPDAMAAALELHHHAIHAAITTSGGRVVKDRGDGLLAIFPDAAQAVTALIEAQTRLAAIDWDLGSDRIRVRMAVDAGAIEERGTDVAGPPLNRADRILDIAHGGQILISDDVVDRLPGTVPLVDLGAFPLKGIDEPVGVHRVVLPEQIGLAPPAGIGWSVRGFELRERLGSGTSGAVYRAVQRSVGRDVAVKIIRPEYANDRRFVQRFEAEAQFVARLAHPRVVALYDYWRDPDGAYLVMPFLRGGSLRQALTGEPWPERKAVRLLSQIGSALVHAHRLGVLHLDVRPTNVLLDEDSNAYLSDFGIASRPIMASGRLPSTSPGYRSPEENRDEPLTERTDQYCLGLLGLELLTGQQPPYLLPKQALGSLPSRLAEPLLRATAFHPEDRFPSVESFLAALGPIEPTVSTEVSRNPFKGLRPFMEADAGDFAGRSDLVDRLVAAVQANPLTAVVGASGSGKSSVVRAGLIPQLRRGAIPGSEEWLITTMYPGVHPFVTLAEALRGVATHPVSDLTERLPGEPKSVAGVLEQITPADSTVVLVVDQFEELFTLVPTEAERRRFIRALAHLVTSRRSPAKVVLTLRADFMDRPLAYSDLASLLQEGLVTVGSPTADELAQCITEPSIDAGLFVDDALVDLIVDQVVDEPGGLPLLEYTLTELFRRRDGNRLTIDAFHEIGGVTGALGSRAEELFGDLDRQAQGAAENLFLRFVNVSDDGTVTRRRVLRGNLEDVDPDALDAIFGSFGDNRLVTFDRDPDTRDPTVELAHDALLTEWPRLAGWIEDRRSDLITERHLATFVAEWDTAGRTAEHLVSGGRLAHFETWAAETDLALTQLERGYLREARKRENDRALRRRRVRNLITAGFALIAIIASLAAIIAVAQSRTAEQRSRDLVEANRESSRQRWDEQLTAIRAEKAEQLAEASAREARARELAAAATANLDVDPELSILLALEAFHATGQDSDGLPEAEEALREALVTNRTVWSAEMPQWTGQLAYFPDGRLLVAGQGTGAIVDAASGEKSEVPAGWLTATVSPDGGLIASVTEQGPDLEDWMDSSLRDQYISPDELNASPTSPGSLAATLASPYAIVIRDSGTGEVVTRLEGHGAPLADLLFLPDGERLASLAFDGTARVWDLDTGEGEVVVEHVCVATECQVVSGLAVSPDGRYLGVATAPALSVYDLQAGDLVSADYPTNTQPTSVAFLADGSYVAVGVAAEGTIHIFETMTGRDVIHVNDLAGTITGLLVNNGGDELVAASPGSGAVHYRFEGTGLRRIAAMPAAGRLLAWSPDGATLASADPGPDLTIVRLFDLSPAGLGEVAAFPIYQEFLAGVSLSSDGRFVAAAHPEGGTAVWEVDSGTLIQHLLNPVDVGESHLPGAFAFSPDGSFLAVAGTTYGLTPDEAAPYEAESPWVNVSWVRIWNVETGAVVFDPMPPQLDSYFSGIGFSRDGTRFFHSFLYSADAGGDVVVFDTSTWSEVLRTSDHAELGWVMASGISPDGSRIALQTFAVEDNVTIWDIDTALVIRIMSHPPTWSAETAFSSDGSRLLTAGEGTPKVWDVATGQEIVTTHGNVDVRRAAWSPGDVWIGGAGQDGTVRIWHGLTGEEELVLRGHTGEVWAIEFGALGMRLATADNNGSLMVWTLDAGELFEIAQNRLTRDFTPDELCTYLHECPAD